MSMHTQNYQHSTVLWMELKSERYKLTEEEGTLESMI